MWRRLKCYLGVGVLNTLLHWSVFLSLHAGLALSQALANFLAFGVAVSFSFYANAAVTFQARATPRRYMGFVTGMGALSLIVGWVADLATLSPWLTMVSFSALSLFSGFLFSHYIVFRRTS
ncbi:Putative flippase GtrA (transmembrane translocase of bactoprenol-linked glucose) [Chromohalobacter canadensis]|uniref:Bactoprenol-linked glucose translocase n=1 Tax=Chromohalobacter canadensis TaxID=141389 RepID=A0A285VFJ2_9GAMM|nr:GtrA family protein [Chromohalobacter canadensis]SOC52855.1 Putative flippase GtrA (transmembrane translocase of bactoprenol-linked glucose) [Chromohalobacter canadensis]